MTERWRKKLGDLDATGPGDDVFTRAHQGPQQPDPQIELPKTSTKIVTGVAAFVVFALAISVFAIPALRMNGGGPASAGQAPLPLWPARSLDDLEALQARADAGDPEAAWVLDPRQVAERFASEVMGWESYAVTDADGEQVAVLGGCGTVNCGGNEPYVTPTGYPSGNATSYPSATPPFPSSTRSFAIVFTGDCRTLCPGRTELVLKQPLEAGEGALWAVTNVWTPGTGTSMDHGDLREGGAIFAGVRVGADEIPTLAYHVGPGSCDVDYATSDSSPRIDLAVGMTLPVQHGCLEPTPGYIWLATATETLLGAESGLNDPFSDGGFQLVSLFAVPVTFLPAYGTSGPPTQPPSTHFSTSGTAVAGGGWEAYTADPVFGWSIEHPALRVNSVDDGVSFPIGDGLSVVIIRISGAPPADDSSFPIERGFVEGDITDNTFRGDGQAFEFFVTSEAGGQLDLTTEQRDTVERMLTSISFARWESGETRHGQTAVTQIIPNATMEWVGFDGERFIVTNDGDGNRAVFGPVPRCDGGGEPLYEVNEAAVASATCGDGTTGSWSAAGVALEGNDPLFQVNLDVAPAVRSWDGWLLVEFSAG